MRCTVIHGSPRRGNTWEVLNIAKDEMRKYGEFEFKDIELGKENIPHCNGCFLCIYKGEDKCPHREKINYIVKEIEDSDFIIITSPTYSMQVSGLLKTFIDHMSYNFHRPKFFKKKALVITTTAGAGHKASSKYIRDILYYWGFNFVEIMPIAYRAMVLSNKNVEKIKDISSRFSKNILSEKLNKPKIKYIFMYNLWRRFGEEPLEYGDADHRYWKNSGLSKHVYHPDINIGVWRGLVGKAAYNIVGMGDKK
ncbi:NAD(P)H-dependent oxidoreductase [Clostridium sp. C8]|jgi:multimeric flavodoxin WrbA|uniref:flavodoxin family protein n=1 Tax=Clostridium sp. C8 TaxID=1667357 RepID=UPI00062E437F|nr:NAD(P)H-dependent oxidoreductase [Clostridium sp. C8]KLE16858.1 NADPH-dependent FMN reductase [Clostridium sp. C8]